MSKISRALLWAAWGSFLVSLPLPIASGPEVRSGAVPGILALILGSFSFVGAAKPNWSGFS